MAIRNFRTTEQARRVQEIVEKAAGLSQALSSAPGDMARLRLPPDLSAGLVFLVLQNLPDSDEYMSEDMRSRTHRSLLQALRAIFPTQLPSKVHRRDLQHVFETHVFQEIEVDLPLARIFHQ